MMAFRFEVSALPAGSAPTNRVTMVGAKKKLQFGQAAINSSVSAGL